MCKLRVSKQRQPRQFRLGFNSLRSKSYVRQGSIGKGVSIGLGTKRFHTLRDERISSLATTQDAKQRKQRARFSVSGITAIANNRSRDAATMQQHYISPAYICTQSYTLKLQRHAKQQSGWKQTLHAFLLSFFFFLQTAPQIRASSSHRALASRLSHANGKRV